MTTNFFRLLAILVTLCASTLLSPSAAQVKTVTETIFDRAANEDNFAFGADISWLSQQESWKTYYCNKAGQRTELMKILQEDYRLNAVRFRVWVNPSGGWSGKQDVINLCKRAHAKGLKIMISFHYSDSWADSKNQTIPAQWTDHSVEALEKKVYEHTYDVLKSLDRLDIHPRWVAIGNETKYGMLYDVGKTKSTEGYKNFARFINSAYQAIQDVDPSMLAVIHLPNAHDEATARNMFDNLQKYGAKYDVIGLSAYPRWSHLDVTTDANIKSTINTYMTTFKNLKKRFNKPVMVVETGHYCDQPLDGNRFLAEFMKALLEDGELGCFYWEPEAFENSGYNLGAWNSKTHQATIAMDAYLGVKHTAVSTYTTTRLGSPVDTLIYVPNEPIELKVYAKTTTKVTAISKVDFLLNGRLVASKEPQEKSNYYTYTTDSLPTGPYSFHAVATDTQGNAESTDTISFLVGPVTIFQEEGEGFIGCSDTLSTIEQTIRRYTGEGYIPASSERKSAVSWGASFPEAGNYTFILRYHTDVAKSVQVHVDDSYFVLKCAPSPLGKWAYASKQMDIAQPGLHCITLQGLTSKGFPDIDLMAIASPSETEPVSRSGNATAVEGVRAESTPFPTPRTHYVYDLSGRVASFHPTTDQLPKGIYICAGKKIKVQ